MKYSEYLELVKAQLPSEIYICQAAAVVFSEKSCSNDVQEHYKKLREYINKLLKKEDAMRCAVGDTRIPAITLDYVIGRPEGLSEEISARVSLLNGHIAYHKARGN